MNDLLGTPRCRSCQAEVVWLKTKNGKPMITDPKIVTVVTDGGETIRGRVPHWATCPSASQWKKAAP